MKVISFMSLLTVQNCGFNSIVSVAERVFLLAWQIGVRIHRLLLLCVHWNLKQVYFFIFVSISKIYEMMMCGADGCQIVVYVLNILLISYYKICCLIEHLLLEFPLALRRIKWNDYKVYLKILSIFL